MVKTANGGNQGMHLFSSLFRRFIFFWISAERALIPLHSRSLISRGLYFCPRARRSFGKIEGLWRDYLFSCREKWFLKADAGKCPSSNFHSLSNLWVYLQEMTTELSARNFTFYFCWELLISGRSLPTLHSQTWARQPWTLQPSVSVSESCKINK